MSWVKLDDRFADHPKVLRAGGDASWLHVTALCYCAGQLTDGFIPASVVGRLSDRKSPNALAEKLVEVGLWEPVEGGFQIHDYLEWNPPAQKVKSERARKAKNAADYRTRRVVEKTGVTKPVTGDAPGDVTPTVTGDEGDTSPPRHHGPSRPVPIPSREKRESSSNRASHLPDEWALTDVDRAFAKSKGWDGQRQNNEAEHFVAHHRAKGTLSKNWGASWRTWVLQGNKFERGGRRGSTVPTITRVQPPAKPGEYDWTDDLPAEKRKALGFEPA